VIFIQLKNEILDDTLTRNLKEKAKLLGADLVGIATVDHFEKEPKEKQPIYYLPAAEDLSNLQRKRAK